MWSFRIYDFTIRPPARILRPHPSPSLPKEKEPEVLAPFSLGRRVGEGFAPLREEGCPDLRKRLILLSLKMTIE